MAKCVFRFLKRQRRKESKVSCYNRGHHVNRATLTTSPSHVHVFGTLDRGRLFRFLEPFDPANVYMKIDAGVHSRCVHLQTGDVYDIADDKRVEPLKAGQQVTLETV